MRAINISSGGGSKSDFEKDLATLSIQSWPSSDVNISNYGSVSMGSTQPAAGVFLYGSSSGTYGLYYYNRSTRVRTKIANVTGTNWAGYYDGGDRVFLYASSGPPPTDSAGIFCYNVKTNVMKRVWTTGYDYRYIYISEVGAFLNTNGPNTAGQGDIVFVDYSTDVAKRAGGGYAVQNFAELKNHVIYSPASTNYDCHIFNKATRNVVTFVNNTSPQMMVFAPRLYVPFPGGCLICSVTYTSSFTCGIAIFDDNSGTSITSLTGSEYAFKDFIATDERALIYGTTTYGSVIAQFEVSNRELKSLPRHWENSSYPPMFKEVDGFLTGSWVGPSTTAYMYVRGEGHDITYTYTLSPTQDTLPSAIVGFADRIVFFSKNGGYNRVYNKATKAFVTLGATGRAEVFQRIDENTLLFSAATNVSYSGRFYYGDTNTLSASIRTGYNAISIEIEEGRYLVCGNLGYPMIFESDSRAITQPNGNITFNFSTAFKKLRYGIAIADSYGSNIFYYNFLTGMFDSTVTVGIFGVSTAFEVSKGVWINHSGSSAHIFIEELQASFNLTQLRDALNGIIIDTRVLRIEKKEV